MRSLKAFGLIAAFGSGYRAICGAGVIRGGDREQSSVDYSR
ncbi:hypothetical protein C4K14_6550 [Pseudomonas chlororaphis subsp. aureofaciens]|nr:hypothetical protein C4K14_6550 [Pseudomonas chlororaphis subsp. aureofaciens]